MMKAPRLLLALLTLAAIGTQLRLHLGASYSAINFFSYFTNLSNLFAACVLLATAFAHAPAARLDLLRYLSTVNMVIVGIVFSVLLRNVDLGALLPWVNVVLHYVMPAAVLLDWLLQPPSARLGMKHLAVALIFPVAYLAWSLARGASAGWYPYPFLDPAHAGGTAAAAYCFGIAALFLVAGWMLLAPGRRTSWFRHR